jgi:dienelactone hydrolase
MSFINVSEHTILRAAICSVFILTVSIFQFSANTTKAQTQAQGAKVPLIPIETFAHMANATSVKVSPNGKWLSMIREIKGVPNIFIQELGNPKNASLIPPSEDLDIDWYEWVNNDWIIFSIKFDGYIGSTPVLKTILGSFDMVTKKMQWIIKPSKRGGTGTRMAKQALPQIQDNVIDILKDEPFHIMVSIDGDRDGENEIRRVDIRNGKFKDTYDDRRGIQNWEMDHLGNLRMGWGFDRYEMKYYYFIPGTKTVQGYDKLPANDKGMMPNGYTDDLDVVIMRQTFSDTTSRILTYNMKTNEIVKVLYENENYSPNGIMYAPTVGRSINGKPIGISYTKDSTETLIFDKDWKKIYASVNKALPNSSNLIVSATEDKKILVISASSDQDPGVYYMWNRTKKQFFELILVNPKIDPAQMAPMQRIDYKARDGLNIPAYLTTPVGVKAKNLPLVVMPHGGPHARTRKAYNYRTQFLANRGYAVLQPNFRGSSGFRKDFENTAKRRWGLEMQDDVTDGVQYLIEQGIVDPKRVCIIGVSYGGYAALMGAVKTPDLYKCAVSINGVTHLSALIAYTKKFIGGNIMSRSIANDDTPSGQLRETSPALQAKKIKAPILLIQYEDDRVVPKSQATSMRRALKRAKHKDFTYKEFPKGGHSMESQQARIEVMTELEKFLAKHLK